MAPKQNKNAGRKDEAKDEPLQAVVLADTFETKFAPFSIERPRCLIPLANTPLIEYTLEYLAASGVQDIFFYAGSHIDQIENYLTESKWLSKSTPFRNLTFLRCMATSIGDIMRDLDQKQLINGDFICVSGDVVSDFPIGKALKAHKQRREKDKNAIMTICLRERNETDYRHRKQIIPTFLIDSTKDRCLHYEESTADASFGTHIDPEMLKCAELDVRQDLIDCRIDVCTPDVLSLWSDNFDNQQPRKDFLFGVLKDYELNGKTIHTYVIEDHYANRVDDPSAYATITHDLQHGIASSLALYNNVSGTRFRRTRKDILKADDVIIQRPSKLDQGTIVDEGTSIGAGTNIHKSVLGKRCQIGKKAKIDSAFIWDDVVIQNNVTVTRAIIGSEAFIGDNCVIEEGALISFGSRVPAGTHVASGKRITSKSTFDQKESLNRVESHEDYDSDEGEPEYDTHWAQSFYQRPEFNDSASSMASDLSDISGDNSINGSRSQSFATSEDTGDRFIQDTASILLHRMQEEQNADDMQSELMGLRFGANADGPQVQKAVAVALTKHINNLVGAGSSPEQATRQTLDRYRYLIRRQNAEQSIEEQVVFLMEAQLDLSKRTEGSRIMPFFVKDLYDLEVFEEDAFTTWSDDKTSQEPGVLQIRDAAKPFIDWLATADEEDSEESEEEEEDDDDDE